MAPTKPSPKAAGLSPGRSYSMTFGEKDRDVHLKHTYKLSGSCIKQIPMLIALALFVWSMTVFKRSGMSILPSRQAACEPTKDPSSSLAAAGTNSDLASALEMRSALRRSMVVTDPIALPDADGNMRVGMRMPLSRGNAIGMVSPDYASELPVMSIFVAPKPYAGENLVAQRRALLSWLRLRPSPKVVILGDDPTFYDIAREFPGQVAVEPNIDYNFLGVPKFHSMVARAMAADTELSMLINGDIILLNDIMPVIYKAMNSFDNWVITAARWDVGRDFPYSFEKRAWRDLGEKGVLALEKEIRTYVRTKGSLHTYGGVDFWLWNNSPMPLHAGVMPPFTFGRSKYDNWMTHEMIASGLRQVLDASEVVTNIHVEHAYSHVSLDNKTADASKNFWSETKKFSWEMFGNIHMAETHGSYTNQKGTALHVPWKMGSCFEPSVFNICLQKRHRPSNCSCEYSPYVLATQTDPKLNGKHWTCGTVSVDKKKDYAINPIAKPNSIPGLPHTMEQLLPQVAKEIDGLKVVTLVAVTFNYAEMLMSFVCRLKQLGLAQNLLVAALDEELYQYCFTQGLPVYYEHASTNLRGLNSQNCAFGSQCFRQFTKLKSRAVLRVLKAGYSVLWTDVDIVWFTDPLPHLMSFGPGTFPIQSNEPNASIPGTGIRRINSGFYFARADKKTVQAFEAITEHASKTKLSEQPSFYDILCGERGERLVRGKEECVWKNKLRTIFLDRATYPNGAVHGFWNEPDVAAACMEKGCAILHNNWISGKDAKKERVVRNGFWHYDGGRRMCVHDWHAKLQHLLKTEEALPSAGGDAEDKKE